MRVAFFLLAIVVVIAYIWMVIATTARRKQHLNYADAALGQLDKEQVVALYHLLQLTIRQLELVQRADALMPFLDDKSRQENERLIRAFYNNELPKGE